MIGSARPLDDIIDRIRKLVALARGGCTEAEAEQAMRRVHALLARHNLDLTEVLKAPSRRPRDDRRIETVESSNHPWERPIWVATASLYFCEYYYSRQFIRQGSEWRAKRIRHNLVGRPQNILVTRLMVDYFLKTVRRLAKQCGATELASERGSFEHSFRVACALRLSARIWERRSEAQRQRVSEDSENRLPVLRSLYGSEDELNRAFLAEMGIELEAGGSRTRVTNILGEMAGREAADSIGLETQIGGAGAVAKKSTKQCRFKFQRA